MTAWLMRILRLAGLAGSALVAGLLLLLLLDAVVFPLYTRQGRETRMPDVIGLDLEGARRALKGQGFATHVERRKSDPTGIYGTGQVMEQFPQAGRLSKSGRRVYLTVCSGGHHVVLPDLRGLTFRKFRVGLADRGLAVDSTCLDYAFDSGQGRGTVLAHFPAAGCSLSPGSAVGARISLGPVPEAVQVPSLLGLSEAGAGWVLRATGLEVGRRHVQLDAALDPGVRLQDPDPGTSLAPGDSVDLWINMGAEQ